MFVSIRSSEYSVRSGILLSNSVRLNVLSVCITEIIRLLVLTENQNYIFVLDFRGGGGYY